MDIYDRTILLKEGESIDVQRASMRDLDRTPSGANLCFDHNQLSKYHATLTNDGGVLKIKDTDSSFGTFVNNQYLFQDIYYPVQDGSIVSFIMVKSFEEIRNKTGGLTRSHEPIMLEYFGSPKLLLSFGVSIQNKNNCLIVDFKRLGKMSKGNRESFKDDVTIIDVMNESDDNDYNEEMEVDVEGSEDELSDSEEEPIMAAKLEFEQDFEHQRENAMVSYHQDDYDDEEEQEEPEDFAHFTDEGSEEEDLEHYPAEPAFSVVDLMTRDFSEGEDDEDFEASSSGIIITRVTETDEERDGDLSDDDDCVYRLQEEDDQDGYESSDIEDDFVDELIVSLLSKPKKSLAESQLAWEAQRESAWVDYINSLRDEALDIETEDDFEEDCTRLIDTDTDLCDFYTNEYNDDTDDEDYTEDTIYYTLSPAAQKQTTSGKLLSLSKAIAKEAVKATIYGLGAIIALGAYSSLSKK